MGVGIFLDMFLFTFLEYLQVLSHDLLQSCAKMLPPIKIDLYQNESMHTFAITET